jgi:Mce-associated membrane protein
MTGQRRLIGVLALLVLVAAVVAAWLARSTNGPDAGVTSAASGGSTSASPATRAEVRDAAAEAAARVYSYSWDTLAADKADARALLTGDMLGQYDRAMAGVATSSRRDHTVVSARVLDTGIVTASSSHARVLVFVNQSTAGDELQKPTLDLDRVLVTLVRTGGAWKVSELDAL